jgi:hypothetical protein
MIPTLIACFFGAAIVAACDPQLLPRPLEVAPALDASGALANPRPCRELKSEDACGTVIMCVWTESRCKERDIALP